MHKIILFILVWMVLGVAVALILHTSGGSSTKTYSTTVSTSPTRTIPSSQPQTSTTPSPVIPDSSPIGGQSSDSQNNIPGTSEDKLRLQLATAGWPAVAKMPYTNSQTTIDLVGVANGRAVINIKYNGELNKARDVLTVFLSQNGDYLSHYSLRFISKETEIKQNQTNTAIALGMRGYIAVPYLPQTKNQTKLVFVGVKGKQIILEAQYSGSLVKARAAVLNILKTLHDRVDRYSIHYQKV